MMKVALVIFCLMAFSLEIKASEKWLPLSKATATWLWMDIYHATLKSTQKKLPKSFLEDETPITLKLCYLKPISKSQLIEGAQQTLPDTMSAEVTQEINRLHQAYQNVDLGDCYQLSYTKAQGTQLQLNGKNVFTTKTQGFKEAYFGIWLGTSPLSDALKTQLLQGVIK